MHACQSQCLHPYQHDLIIYDCKDAKYTQQHHVVHDYA